jgi:outer membrane protein assembly factor BamD
MKKIFLFLFIPVIFWGCSGSIETSNLSGEERLKYSLELYNDEDYEEAVSEFQAILLQYPGSEVVDDAQFYLAQSRYKRGEFILAAYEFSRLVQNMPASEFVAESQYMLAECYYALSPNFALDQTYTVKAIQEYQAFIDFFPADKRVPECESKINEMNEKLARKAYNAAYIYEKMEYYTAAILYYGNVVELYHDTPYASMAMYDKIRLLIQRGKNSEAIKEINRFIERYPGNTRIPDVEKMRNDIQGKISASNK